MSPVSIPRAHAALLAALVGAACAGPAPRPAGPPAPARAGPAPAPAVLAYQVLDLRDAALNARDLETAARAYAPDAVVIDADAAAVVLRGRAEIREAHARFLDACPRARVEVLDRTFDDHGRLVTDVERVRCTFADPVQGWVRYEISGGAILRVLKHRSPPFGG
jgi:hypothetical protein